MGNSSDVPWDDIPCQEIISRLKDGEPPPSEAIEFLSVGYEDHLARARDGLDKARLGHYDIIVLEGRYGIGKSHFLNRVGVIARQQGFVVKHVELGSGVYFNNPDSIYRHVLANDQKPSYHYYWRGDRVRKFVGELKALAEMYVARGRSGLVILFDEMENTFSSYYLNRFPSRAKAYRFIGALFKGHDEGGDGYFLDLANIFVVMAITPGTIQWAKTDGHWLWSPNPAHMWILPERREILPLDDAQAMELAKRIRAIHSSAFAWRASRYVKKPQLERICQEWLSQGIFRDERQLVKSVVSALELAEQNR